MLNYSNHLGTINFSKPTIFYMINGTVVNSTNASYKSLSDYYMLFLDSYSYSLNMSAAPAYIYDVSPIYGKFVQNQVAFGYKNYVIGVTAFGILGEYNENYTKAIAMHVLGLLKAGTS